MNLELYRCDLSATSLPTRAAVRRLVLDYSNITDEQMRPVATYQHLEYFSANKTGLTDEGLLVLRDLPLRWISLIETPASVELVGALLETESVTKIQLSELQFQYSDFADVPRSRNGRGTSRYNIHHKNWLKHYPTGSIVPGYPEVLR